MLVVAGAVGALLIPAAASARLLLQDLQPYTVSVPAAPDHQVSSIAAQSFSWHDAGFGAAGMLVLVAIGAGATLAVRRRAVLS